MAATHLNPQLLTLEKVRSYEQQLQDVIEIIDHTYLKDKLVAVEQEATRHPNELPKVRLGVVYHEVALNLSFLSKTSYRGYAQKSFDLLTELAESSDATPELLPVILAYRASALSLVGAETKKLSLLGKAFALFDEAVRTYATVSSTPEFLRGSVAENLPWFFFSKRKVARHDFQSIIEKYQQNSIYADAKTMSFTYWAWANQHQSKKHRPQSLEYLELAIKLDPHYEAGRERAEILKQKLMGNVTS
ncbi:tetratricopeptide (TPR) repeat protein [Siphonobacter sp. BAB-5404]|nr:tetratricopeptide (TPR) repeat protein [Siphonobacter sp. SORGH_AS_0500]